MSPDAPAPVDRMCLCTSGPGRTPCGKTWARAVSDLMDRQMLNREQAEATIRSAQRPPNEDAERSVRRLALGTRGAPDLAEAVEYLTDKLAREGWRRQVADAGPTDRDLTALRAENDRLVADLATARGMTPEQVRATCRPDRSVSGGAL